MIRATAFSAASLLLLAGCGGHSFEEMKGVEVFTTAGADSKPSEVGVLVPFSEMKRLAEGGIAAEATPDFDDDARAQTFLDHAQIDYAPHGHGPPGVNDVPHFDIHFHGISQDDRLAIDCANEPMPEADKVPDDYAIPGTGEPPFGSCVKKMGIHASDLRSPGQDPKSPAPLTRTMVMGYHGGELTFLEPMIEKDALLAKETIELEIRAPAKLGRATLWPRLFRASYDEEADAYRFVVADFVAIE